MPAPHATRGIAAIMAFVALVAPAVAAVPDLATDVTIPPGTAVDLLLQTRLTSASARAGDAFCATTLRALWIGGRAVLPAGTMVRGEIESVMSLHDGAHSGFIGLKFVSIEVPGVTRPHRIIAGLTGQRQDDRPPLGGPGEQADRVEAVLVGRTTNADSRAHLLVGDDLAHEYSRTSLSGIDVEVAVGTMVTMEFDEPLTVPVAMRRAAAASEARRVHASPETVATAQRELGKCTAYHGEIDGRLGSDLRQAIMRFQFAHAQEATGDLDDETLRLLGIESDGKS
jgi:Putative peptidoglycan binding domain